ncbi:glutaredoxin domain-containing protein [Pseudoalteromonas luteoviolacea]|uniref:Glutaredoxin domain-containing protein n=1 Tax=Pseudoalteromonas luteoviolacea S4060-1 TaxID=1365257 RepID=A0A162AXM3_9GAMM|nr:glutaredoxin domain-containing protein [Pseudoalteromonas luteoviolacea]KZN63362.1 hypothetical protein N478_03675 [Pseudoalteromonas luteoviolacea S4060-1]
MLDCPLVLDNIDEDVVVFTLEQCAKCIETKNNLYEKGVSYKEIEMEVCRFTVLNNQIKRIDVAPTIVIKRDGGFKILI